MIEVDNIREAIIQVMKDNPSVSKYRLAKDLNLSSATHINNYLAGTTKKPRSEVNLALYKKYGVLVKEFKDSAVYRSLIEKPETGVKL